MTRHLTRPFLALPILLVALAPALMGQETCTASPSSIDVSSPAPASVVGTPVVPITITLVNADETSLSVRVDGNDVTSAFTKTNLGANTTAQGNVALGAGPHTIVTSVQSSKGTHTDTSAFQVTFPAFFVPDQVITGLVPVGTPIVLRGTVKGASYKSVGTIAATSHPATATGGSEFIQYQPGSDRYALFEISQTAGLTVGQQAWGVGAKLTHDQWVTQRLPIPYPGDVVEVTGTVAKETFGGEERFVIAPVSQLTTVTSPNPALGDVGAGCSQDTQCRDDLICSRTSLTCSTFSAIGWGGDPRGVNGACTADADCPAGQFCDPAYAIVTSGTYGIHYSVSRDTGRRICRVTSPQAPLEELCPRTVTTDDVHSGRFKEGKEVCLRATVHFPLFNPGDNDVHVQAALANPHAYPVGSPPVALVGHATEVAPPYRDPANPSGKIDDPPPGVDMVAIGTVKYDDSHEWYEVHPIKWWRAAQ